MIDFTSFTNQDDLYQALTNEVEPILNDEAADRKVLIAQFEEDTKLQMAQYTADTFNQTLDAEQALKPIKDALDTEMKAILARAEKLMQSKTKAFAKKQKVIQDRFDLETAEAKTAYEAAVKPLKDILEAELERLGKRSDDLIAPINAAYRDAAEKIGA